MNGLDIHPVEARALESYMLERTIPLITEETVDGEAGLLGTCTLIQICGRYFLVTADHVLDGRDLLKIAIPTHPRSGELWTIGSVSSYFVYRHETYQPENLDTAIIQIQSEAVSRILESGWKPLPLDLIDGASSIGKFALCGYPESLTKKLTDLLIGKLLTVYTGRLPNAPFNADKPVYPELDLFFLCDDSAQNLFGAPGVLPSLNGTSGSSIWEIREPKEGEAWTPERVLRVVGINSSYRKGEYFRAKKWWAAAAMFEKMEEQDVALQGRFIRERLF